MNKPKPRYLFAILAGGGLGGLLNLAAAFVLFSQTRDASPIVVLHAVASGFYGATALEGGLGVAAIGLTAHMLISIIAASVYALTVKLFPTLFRHMVLACLAFSVGVFVIMNYVVVPLSAAVYEPSHEPAVLAARFLIQLFTLSIPIVFFVHRFAVPTSAAAASREL